MIPKVSKAVVRQLAVEYSMDPVQFIQYAMEILPSPDKKLRFERILKGIKQKAKKRAKQRQLSMDEFIRFCVEAELQRQFTRLHRVAIRLNEDWYARLKEVSANEPSRWVRTTVFEELKIAGFEALEPLNDLRTFNDGTGAVRKTKSTGNYILRVALPEEYRSAIQLLYGERNVSYVIKRWMRERMDTDSTDKPLTSLRPRKAVDDIWPSTKEPGRRDTSLSGRRTRRVDFD